MNARRSCSGKKAPSNCESKYLHRVRLRGRKHRKQWPTSFKLTSPILFKQTVRLSGSGNVKWDMASDAEFGLMFPISLCNRGRTRQNTRMFPFNSFMREKRQNVCRNEGNFRLEEEDNFSPVSYYEAADELPLPHAASARHSLSFHSSE